MEQIKILVIDDDAVDRLSLKRSLKHSGFSSELTEVAEAMLGIKLLKENQYDCIFLDYLLPGTDGLTVLKKIKCLGIKTPVIVTTSQGDEGVAVEMMKAGASDYIVKNQVNNYVISQVLRNALRLAKVEREREEAQRALVISQERLAEAQWIAHLGNWEFEMETQKIFWSKEVYRIVEVDPQNYTPTLSAFLNYFSQEDQKFFMELVESTEKDLTFNRDFRMVLPSEVVKYITIQGYVDRNDLDGAKKLIGTIQDITRRKWYEEELIKARYVAEESMVIKEKFLANMSHEIRTPMNAIIGFTRLLLGGELDPAQKEYVNAIRFSGENLLVIINDILDFSKIQSGKLVIEEIDFSLMDVLNPVVNIFSRKAQDKGLDFIFENEVDIASFQGDPVRLNQVLNNLIDNAIKFTQEGFVKLSVKQVSDADDKVEVEFKIEDTGIGIAESKLESVFESFTQATSDTTRKFGGTGLGLTIVKNIIELQNGSITLESSPGKGSVFTIRLSYKKSVNTQNENLLEEDEIIDLRNVKVLLAEDNELNQLLTKTVLANAGCKVDIAENGAICLEMLKESEYDIILMDIQMPELDGYETTFVIRNQLLGSMSEIPIMALTADALSTETEKCFGAGMNDYISKPFKAEELIYKIHQLLNMDNKFSMGKYA